MPELERMNALSAAREQIPSSAQFYAPRAADNYNASQAADNYSGDSHVDRLDAARKNSPKEIINNVKDLAETASPMGAFSLLKQIDPIADMPYVVAGGAALLKDGLDLVDAETVILPIVFSGLCGITIFMMLLLVDGNKKKKEANGFLNKLGILGAAGVADSIPGLDYFPIESASVAFLYFNELRERQRAQK